MVNDKTLFQTNVVLYGKKFLSAKNLVKSDRPTVRQEFIFVKRSSPLVALAIDCSALGMGVATDRGTRSVLPRAYALDNAADLRGRIFITSTTTRQNAPSPSCGVSLALDL